MAAKLPTTITPSLEMVKIIEAEVDAVHAELKSILARMAVATDAPDEEVDRLHQELHVATKRFHAALATAKAAWTARLQ